MNPKDLKIKRFQADHLTIACGKCDYAGEPGYRECSECPCHQPPPKKLEPLPEYNEIYSVATIWNKVQEIIELLNHE